MHDYPAQHPFSAGLQQHLALLVVGLSWASPDQKLVKLMAHMTHTEAEPDSALTWSGKTSASLLCRESKRSASVSHTHIAIRIRGSGN